VHVCVCVCMCACVCMFDQAENIDLALPVGGEKIGDFWLTPGNHGYQLDTKATAYLSVFTMILLMLFTLVHYSRRQRRHVGTRAVQSGLILCVCVCVCSVCMCVSVCMCSGWTE